MVGANGFPSMDRHAPVTQHIRKMCKLVPGSALSCVSHVVFCRRLSRQAEFNLLLSIYRYLLCSCSPETYSYYQQSYE